MRGYSAVGLIRPKHGANVGAVMRAAYVYRAKLIAVEGWRKSLNWSSDTMKAWRHTPTIRTADLFSVIPYSVVPVAIEIRDDAEMLPRFTHPERAFYIFGPEDGDLPEKTVSRCVHVVRIPTRFCMNLAATVNVVLYDRLVKRNEWLTKSVQRERAAV